MSENTRLSVLLEIAVYTENTTTTRARIRSLVQASMKTPLERLLTEPLVDFAGKLKRHEGCK